MLHLRAVETTRGPRWLHTALRAVGRIRSQIRQEPVGPVNGIWHFRRYWLMQGNRPSMTLHRVMLLLTLTLELLAFQLLAFALTLFTFSMYHFLLLSLSFDQLTFSRISLALSIEGLWRRVLHCLTDTR